MSSSLDKGWNWPLDAALEDNVRAWWADERPPVLVGWEGACALSSAIIIVSPYWIDEEKVARGAGGRKEERATQRGGETQTKNITQIGFLAEIPNGPPAPCCRLEP